MKIHFHKNHILTHRHHGQRHYLCNWPWWQFFSLKAAKITVCPPSTGYRLWVYTRGRAHVFDLVFDRRSV